MYYHLLRLIPFFILSSATISYAQFEKEIVFEANQSATSSTKYRFVTALDADSDTDKDVIGEVTPAEIFSSIYINMNLDLRDDVPGWNNLGQEPSAGVTVPLTNVKGETTSVELTLNTAWEGAGRQGYDNGVEDGVYPNGVTRSYYFTRAAEQLTVSGLNPAKRYNFTFYASSLYPDDRSARYQIGGQSAVLDASYNEMQTVSIEGAQPDSEGNIIIAVSPTATTKNYLFLGSIVIEPTQIDPKEYVLLTNNAEVPFDSTLLIDANSNWSFAKTVDLNKDGYEDIVSYDIRAQQLLWYRNQNGTTFARTVLASDLPVTLQMGEIHELDINRDGRLDLVVARGNQLYWYQQLSSQTFATGAVWTSVSMGEASGRSFLTTGSVDDDGTTDIVWQYGTQIYPLFSKNAYAIGQPLAVSGIASPMLLATADMNGDGQDDIAITEAYSWTGEYRVSYLTSNGSSVGTAPTYLTVSNFDLLNQRPARLLNDDIDQDGDQDFYIYTTAEACGCIYPPQTGWIENQGSWQSAQFHEIQAQDANQWVDVDQDGDQDLVGTPPGTEGIYWAENVDGRWDNIIYKPLDQPLADQIGRVTLSDINQDDYVDLTVQASAHIIRLDNQQGTIASPTVSGQISSALAAAVFGDIDGDDLPELLIADVDEEENVGIRWTESSTNLDRELVIYQGGLSGAPIFLSPDNLLFAPTNEEGSQYGWWKLDGEGNFALSGTIAGSIKLLADINGDNLADVVTESAWYRNSNNSSFQAVSNAKGHQAVDFDGDGDLDIMAIPDGSSIIWYRNNGNSSFTATTLSISKQVASYFADLDADGDADVIQSNATSTFWRENQNGQGTWGDPVSIDNFGATQLQATDMDANGKQDIVANNDKTLVLYKNAFQQTENTAPVVKATIDDQTIKADENYVLDLPSDAFVDNDTDDVLTYQAKQEDGSDLPAWLTFNQDTQSFSGTPAEKDTGTVVIQVQVTDSKGATASQTFNLTVEKEDSGEPGTGEPGTGGGEPGEGEPGEGEPENPVTSIGDEQPEEVVLYPNPVVSGDLITIKNIAAHEFKAGHIYTAQGKTIKVSPPQGRDTNVTIDSSSLTPGVYLVEIHTTQQTLRKKIIVR